MNREADNGLLLNDVLADAAAPDFRGVLLDQTLGLVCRRRRWRQTRRVAGIVAVLGLLGIVVWQKNLPQRVSAPVAPAVVAKVAERSYTLIRTQPLPVGKIVTTQPLAGGQFAASVAPLEIVQSSSGHYRVISDTQLLALLTSHPALLVQTGPHSERLIFANPEDEMGFPVN